jgi:predicted DNA-binding protein
MRTLSLEIPDELFDRLQTEAARRGTTVAALARPGIEHAVYELMLDTRQPPNPPPTPG